MPDDVKDTEQEEKEALDAFAEDDDVGGEVDKGKTSEDKDIDKKSEDEKDEKTSFEEEKTGEEDTGNKDEKKDTDKADGKSEIEKRLEERLASEKDEEEPEKKAPEKEEPIKEEKKDEKKDEIKDTPISLTKEKVSELLKVVADTDLPGEMIIGDLTVNLKEYAEEFPEDFNAIKIISSTIAEKIVNKALAGFKVDPGVKPKDINNEIGGVKVQLAQLSYESHVARATDDEGNLKHPDFYDIVYGKKQDDFRDWLKEQPKKTQKLATSLNPADGILMLDFYKEHLAKKKVKAHDEKTGKQKQEYDDIHKSGKNLKTGKRPAEDEDQDPNDIAKQAFEEED